jgi:two-component system, cell cycle response regulator
VLTTSLRIAAIPRRRLRLLPALKLAGAVGLAVFFARAATGFGGEQADRVFNDGLYNALLVLAAGMCLARALLRAGQRGAWLALGLGISAWVAGDLHYALAYGAAETPPFPSLGDVFYLAFYPASYAALVLLLRARVREFRQTLWVDGVAAGLAAAALSTSVIFDVVHGATEGSPQAVVVNLAYPIGDILLLALVVAAFALTGGRPGRPWGLIALGLVTAAVADVTYLWAVSAGTYREGAALDALWPAAMLLLAYAAWQGPEAPRPIRLGGRRLLIVPATCALVGVGVLAYDHFSPINELALALAILTVLAVVARLDLTFAEKQRLFRQVQEQAVTDSLTGLGNRRRLLSDLDAVLAGLPPVPTLLMLFDLDGFKRYNDSYGHPAGDALLARLGKKLDRAMRPYGRSYRLGGDEFCVLAPLHGGDGETIVHAAATALRERGDGFSVGSSFGAVLLPEEADEPADALRLADQRLYARKAAAARRGRSHDVLLQALYEREPGLHEHVRAVAALAAAVGRRLGLPEGGVEELVQAAELHDVGKLAVPDDVLRKQGPLDADEWDLVRHHTLIGERILSASPQLLGIGRIVRSTHERWDGRGYPDGLRGDEIPLASRIVHACDAFVSAAERSDGAPRPRTRALAALRACAGTQFDPAVVEAVSTVAHEADLASSTTA